MIGRNGLGCKPWHLIDKSHKEPYRDDARAAITAMRIPTSAMLNSAQQICPHALDTWETMIDVARLK